MFFEAMQSHCPLHTHIFCRGYTPLSVPPFALGYGSQMTLLQSYIIFQNLIIYSLLCCMKYLCNASTYWGKNTHICKQYYVMQTTACRSIVSSLYNPLLGLHLTIPWLLQGGKKLSMNALLQTYT